MVVLYRSNMLWNGEVVRAVNAIAPSRLGGGVEGGEAWEAP